MVLIDDLKNSLKNIAGEWQEKNSLWEFKAVIAERKSFLNKKKLTYSAKMRINEEAKEVKFTEMLKESGFGLSAGGGGMDGEISPGFGFKTESYNTLSGVREGSISEQSDLFGKKYDYQFEWGTIRKTVEAIAKQNGYEFKYQITSLGL
ncbi:MAG: hypothetical protein NTZ97_01465 [Candidatus Moranbacteria bacterium]|nr:hypothetical protein [Candidatus Moranbacteria bacterium]